MKYANAAMTLLEKKMPYTSVTCTLRATKNKPRGAKPEFELNKGSTEQLNKEDSCFHNIDKRRIWIMP